MRWDEHGWDNYGPAQDDGPPRRASTQRNIVAHDCTSTATPATHRPRPQELSARRVRRADPGGGRRRRRIGDRTTPRTAACGEGAAAGRGATSGCRRCGHRRRRRPFACEQIIDELAYAAKHGSARVPPAEHRQQRPLGAGSRRSTRPLEAANWQPRVAASNLSKANVVTGRGVGFGVASSARRRRRHRGEQEDRQDPGQARLRRPGPASWSTRTAREPDERQRDRASAER